MVVFVQISNVGSDAGPFIITANNGATVSPNTFTAAQLIAGQNVTLSSNSATGITVTSTGLCTNSSSVLINLIPTTTSSTTVAPTTSTTTLFNITTSTTTVVNTPTTTSQIIPSTTTTSTTINCCQGGGFHSLPLPGSSSSIISNGVTITASYTVPTSPLGVIQLSSSTICPSCYSCGNYSYMIGSGVPISTSWGPTYAWDYILNFSEPITSINLFMLNFSSTEFFDVPSQTWLDASLEGIEFTTDVGNPNIELCEGCSVNIQGNKIYAESATIGNTGVKNGSGIFRISSNTPFSTLKMTDIRIFTNSSICYYCGPDYSTSVFWSLCGQVGKPGSTTPTTTELVIPGRTTTAPPQSTSTTTQPPQFVCNCFKITNLTGSPRLFTYVRCGVATTTITLDPFEVRYICAQGTPATQVNVLIENLGTTCIDDDGISCG